MAKGIAGKLMRVKLNDRFLACQLDCTVNFDNTFDEDEANCKPSTAELVTGGSWVERDEIDTQDWSVTVNVRSFLEAFDEEEMIEAELVQANIDGNLDMEVQICTTPGQHNYPFDRIIEGNVKIGSIALNLPESGKATADITLPGNGKPEQTMVPVEPAP